MSLHGTERRWRKLPLRVGERPAASRILESCTYGVGKSDLGAYRSYPHTRTIPQARSIRRLSRETVRYKLSLTVNLC
jgi:hypothetical protein